MARRMFVFFLVSGFCSLAYEVIWLRLAMAGFGVTTPLVSIVLSVFMGGLGLGSWLGGRIARALESRPAGAVLQFYALTELFIGISGLVVPYELQYGQRLLARLGDQVAWASGAHHLASGVWISLTLLPFCTAMGATFPIGIAALRRATPESSERSFSFLYGANVLGATLGTLVTAFVWIELFGFRGTGRAVAALNGLIAAGALASSLSAAPRTPFAPAPSEMRVGSDRIPVGSRSAAPWLLFTTGLVSMGMEVVWVRQFAPFLGTVVYAFASILAIYLGATFLGALAYRRWAQSPAAGASPLLAEIWIVALLSGLFSLLLADPRLTAAHSFATGLSRLIPGIAPFCAAVGFVTPMLVDRWSGGDPRRAGSVYAMNIVGCVLGPLLASFVLLPQLGERWSLVMLSVPLAAVAATLALRSARIAKISRFAIQPRAALIVACALAAVIVFGTKDFETLYPVREVRRDYAATVIAATDHNGDFELLVNGIGITRLTTTTKMMVHMPLVHLPHPPRQVLVICFGMGTTFRSSVAWGVPTTAVDLIPSVPALFPYFHYDAARVSAAPGARVLIDDGRRFLERSVEQFDVVTIDPPPPLEAAGSSLLYSREFYEAIKRRLAPGGIVQQWFPGGDPMILMSVTRALLESFPHVRAFLSPQGSGLHYLASMDPIPVRDAASLASQLPPDAAADLVAWTPGVSAVNYFEWILAQELVLPELMKALPDAPALEDDRPLNEYFFLRWLSGKRGWLESGRG
jgi:spermidine synthase